MRIELNSRDKAILTFVGVTIASGGVAAVATAGLAGAAMATTGYTAIGLVGGGSGVGMSAVGAANAAGAVVGALGGTAVGVTIASKLRKRQQEPEEDYDPRGPE